MTGRPVSWRQTLPSHHLQHRQLYDWETPHWYSSRALVIRHLYAQIGAVLTIVGLDQHWFHPACQPSQVPLLASIVFRGRKAPPAHDIRLLALISALLCLAADSRSLVSLQSGISQRSSQRVVEGALSLLDLGQPAATLTPTSYKQAPISYPFFFHLFHSLHSLLRKLFSENTRGSSRVSVGIDRCICRQRFNRFAYQATGFTDSQILSLIYSEKRQNLVIYSVLKVMAG